MIWFIQDLKESKQSRTGSKREHTAYKVFEFLKWYRYKISNWVYSTVYQVQIESSQIQIQTESNPL